MIAILFERFFFKAPLLSFTIEYHAALKMFKIYDSTAFDFSDDEDKMDYLPESSDGEADW